MSYKTDLDKKVELINRIYAVKFSIANQINLSEEVVFVSQTINGEKTDSEVNFTLNIEAIKTLMCSLVDLQEEFSQLEKLSSRKSVNRK